MSINNALANRRFDVFSVLKEKQFKNPPTVLKLKRANGDRLLIEIELKTDNEEMYKELADTIGEIVSKYVNKLNK